MEHLFRPALQARRQLPRFGVAGETLEYHVRVHNKKRADYRSLQLGEYWDVLMPDRQAFLNEPEPGEEARNGFDRLFLYYRWYCDCRHGSLR